MVSPRPRSCPPTRSNQHCSVHSGVVVYGIEGHTLVEAVISLLISSLLVFLVGTTFLVQNRLYATNVLRAAAQTDARSASELIATEIRSVMSGGVEVAGKHTLTVRAPMGVAVVCAQTGSTVHVYSGGGEAWLDTAEVAGVARRDTLGAWTYASAKWSQLNGEDGRSPAYCAYQSGSDTTGASSDYHQLRELESLVGYPDNGELVMLFRETTFSVGRSEMRKGSLGLFRAASDGQALEYATGMDAASGFQYRLGGGEYVDTVPESRLGLVDAVRVVAEARRPPPTGGQEDVTFGWSVNVALRNVRANR